MDADRAITQVLLATRRWDSALHASADALPSPEFIVRLSEVAEAAEQQAAAIDAASSAKLGWRARPGARAMELSHELSPRSSRPGTEELWARFDAAVEGLGIAMEGDRLEAVGEAFGVLAERARVL